MKRTRVVMAGLLVSLAFMGMGCAAKKVTQERTPPRMMEFEDFITHETAPGVYFAGQPSPASLEEYKAAGGTTVINLRTDKELAFMPYYSSVHAEQGFAYTHIPCSGSTMGPAEYESFIEAYKAAEAPVLIHCASGGRARMMWAAYEQEELGLSREQVLANAAARGQDSEGAQTSINAMLDRVAGVVEITAPSESE